MSPAFLASSDYTASDITRNLVESRSLENVGSTDTMNVGSANIALRIE